MTQPFTPESPAVRLYAAEEAALTVLKNRCFGIDLCNPASMKSWAKQIVDAVSPFVLAERTAELEARVKVLEEALASIGIALGISPVDEKHARHNLDGALIDCRHSGFDEVCGRTIERVQKQLEEVEDVFASAALENRDV
jgi:hypothetical protein